MFEKLKKFYFKYEIWIFSILAFIVPFTIYVLTLERKIIGGDTTWYALKLPAMQVMVPTGYPTFSIIGKIFSMIPLGDLAFRLNLISAVFGASTVLVLFLAARTMFKNTLSGFAASMIFAFLHIYWTVANRLEFDTIKSFFLALMLYSAFLYTESPERKYFYFFAAASGFSLTNHPIAFFILPAMILYVFLVRPAMFKNAKAVFTGILFLLMPLSLYAWLPVRSIQGYGTVTTPLKFIYYVIGRDITGTIHGGSFGDKGLRTFLNTGAEFFTIIFNNVGIILLAIAFVGLVYLFKKNLKFALCSILLIIFNVIIVALYLDYTPDNYTLNAIMIIAVYIASGFTFFYETIITLFERMQKRHIKKQAAKHPSGEGAARIKYYRLACISILFIAMFSLPVLLASVNYRHADYSRPRGIYVFWDSAIKNMEDSSILYTYTPSENIAMFVSQYENPQKNITVIRNNDERYNIDKIRQNVLAGKNVYFAGTDANMEYNFETERIGEHFFWDWHNENLILKRLIYPSFLLELSYNAPAEKIPAGKSFTIEYEITNLLEKDTKIDSIELELPDEIEFIQLGKQSSISAHPGKARGIFIWVGDDYYVRAKDDFKIAVELLPLAAGDFTIKARITTSNLYVEFKDFSFEAVK